MRLPSFRTIAISALVAGVAIAAPAYAKNPNVGLDCRSPQCPDRESSGVAIPEYWSYRVSMTQRS